jgi:glycosyltransferase involved in cell wall biosynthesis
VAFPLGRRFLDRIPNLRLRSAWSHRLDNIFDAWLAPQVEELRPTHVVAYENSALHTFHRAREFGAHCVLDAAAVHPQAAHRWLEGTGREDPPWIRERKLQEIDLADTIITCSPLAAQTYLDAGVSGARVRCVALGTDLCNQGWTLTEQVGLCSFVFVGNLRTVKGGDLLLDAFERMASTGYNTQLTIIGGVSEPILRDRLHRLANARMVPFVPKPALFDELRKHHVLVLPSRFDAFGMVIPEAMSVGLPVVVSTRVGAKCILEAHPGAGWVCEPDTDDLLRTLLELVHAPEQVSRASKAAVQAAQAYTWEEYRRRVTCIFQSMIQDSDHGG